MLRYRAGKAASVLLACAAFAVGMANRAQASTLVDWSGQDSFTTDRITFTGFTADQLSSIAGDGTYTSSSYFNYFTWSQVPVNTTFDLELRLNGTWTTVSTWTLDSLNNVKLSTLTTPINFATSVVSGIELTATPDDYGNNYNDMNLSLYQDCGKDVEQETFTFNNVATTPLPATLPLFAGGLGFVGYWARRRKGSAKQALATA
jgi:hypothetical protein